MDMTETIAPKSDQINAEDLLTGPRTFTVAEVRKGSAEQPVDIHLVEFPGRPYRPSKTERRVIVSGWGVEASEYAGKRFTLYRDPEVTFGRDKVGGIKISHMSHIDKRLELMLTATRGRRAKRIVEPLVESTPTPEPVEVRAGRAVDWFAAKGVARSNLEAHVGKPVAEWSDADVAELKSNAEQIVGGAS
jgi:hypothetical protein